LSGGYGIAAYFAAVHGKCTVYAHAAAGITRGIIGIAADLAAIHNELAAGYYVHAARTAGIYTIAQKRTVIHNKHTAVVDPYKMTAAIVGKITVLTAVAVNNNVLKYKCPSVTYSKQIAGYAASKGDWCVRICTANGKRYICRRWRGDVYHTEKRDVLIKFDDDIGLRRSVSRYTVVKTCAYHEYTVVMSNRSSVVVVAEILCMSCRRAALYKHTVIVGDGFHYTHAHSRSWFCG
jgi:hypothetical protein